MAETLISPGVLARENDNSFVTQQPVTVGAAIIGPTVKGPVEIPTVVTTYSDYVNKFGTTFLSGGQEYSYLTSIAAYNYFQQGGQSLLVARVASGSFTSATDTGIYSSDETGVLTTGSFLSSITTNVSASAGTYNNVATTTSGTGVGATFNVVVANPSGSVVSSIVVSGSGTGYNIGDTLTIASSSLGASTSLGTNLVITLTAANIVSEVAFTLKTISEGIIMNSYSTQGANGTLPSGSADNVRWQILNSNSSSGTFDLLVKQGNDTATEPFVLET